MHGQVTDFQTEEHERLKFRHDVVAQFQVEYDHRRWFALEGAEGLRYVDGFGVLAQYVEAVLSKRKSRGKFIRKI